MALKLEGMYVQTHRKSHLERVISVFLLNGAGAGLQYGRVWDIILGVRCFGIATGPQT